MAALLYCHCIGLLCKRVPNLCQVAIVVVLIFDLRSLMYEGKRPIRVLLYFLEPSGMVT